MSKLCPKVKKKFTFYSSSIASIDCNTKQGELQVKKRKITIFIKI